MGAVEKKGALICCLPDQSHLTADDASHPAPFNIIDHRPFLLLSETSSTFGRSEGGGVLTCFFLAVQSRVLTIGSAKYLLYPLISRRAKSFVLYPLYYGVTTKAKHVHTRSELKLCCLPRRRQPSILPSIFLAYSFFRPVFFFITRISFVFCCLLLYVRQNKEGGTLKRNYKAFSSDDPCGANLDHMEGNLRSRKTYACRDLR